MGDEWANDAGSSSEAAASLPKPRLLILLLLDMCLASGLNNEKTRGQGRLASHAHGLSLYFDAGDQKNL
jgi:hypothetical protein